MSNLKDRVERLESQLSQLQATLQRERGKTWQRAVEKYAGDNDLQAVFAEAMKLRQADRKHARTVPGNRRGKQG